MGAFVSFVVRWASRLVFVVFALGYAAGSLPPDVFWWTGPFAVLLPPVAALASGLAVLDLGRTMWQRRPRQAAWPVLILLLVLIRFGGTLGGGGEPGSQPEEGLRVMSFNVPQYTADESAADRSLLKLFATEAPHVVGLQEAALNLRPGPYNARRSSPRLRTLLANTRYRPPNVLPDRFRVEQIVVGRIPLDSLEVSEDGLPPQPDVRFDDLPFAVRVVFRWRGHRVVLYNVHLNSVLVEKPWKAENPNLWAWSFWAPYVRQYRQGVQRRAVQARTLRTWIDAETAPVLVTGDFNGTRHNWAYRHIADGMTDALAAAGRGPTRTFPADTPLIRIDHILASDHWTVLDAHVPDIRAVSDHRPVVATLRLNVDE